MAGALSGTTVGFIGLGLMGRPMSRALAAAGADVVAWSRDPAKRDAAAADGLRPVDTAGAVARACDILILMLADTPAVESVLADLLPALRPGTVVIDMGTTAPQATLAFAAKAAERGGRWVDAPVSGGEVGAREATLTIMAGGEAADFARAAPLFRAMGRTVTHVGATGAGQVAKAANQVIVGVTIAAVAEALALARRAGVDPLVLRDTLLGGFAASRVLDLHGRRMATGELAPGARSTTQRKDLAQALALADDLGLDMPVTRLTRDLYDRLIAQGDGDLDHAALIRLYG
ncbi:NAD(P)-dependent oxidoreductase [Novispirillum sp. DQ9]|uniref:NAD(P)-dependent oxidoreductase n=1 Tax=Novispirillum sp. DQ9 TaxID=3398612 RepID=UPI003C7B651E